ncbi:MAG: hypothetical protein N2595_08730 [bacterium]|nr:hypothetical protein [bacterium]
MNRALVYGAVILLLTACVEYQEEWFLNTRGGGHVRVTCQPSPQWRAAHPPSEWDHAARVFIPPYHALSQACAQAGVRIERCRFTYRAPRRVPRVELLLAFDALPHIARCTLFADRALQWRRDRNSITFLHSLHAYPATFPRPANGPLPPAWFADGRVTITIRMPGRIVHAEGGRVKHRTLVASASLNELAAGTPLSILIEARVPWRWWWLVMLFLLLTITIVLTMFFSPRRRVKHQRRITA